MREGVYNLRGDHVTEGSYNSNIEFILFILEFGLEVKPSLGEVSGGELIEGGDGSLGGVGVELG